MGSRAAECSRLRDGNEYADVIEIGRFAHAQHSAAALIIALRSSIWKQGTIRHSGDSRQPGNPGHRAAESISVNDLSPAIRGFSATIC